ncbi:MAG TPA: chemotaxis protein CheW [Blastocatellia bacterium]|nr:chemotaxis protein CheW [Blastocatellia bacterium]
MAAKQQMIIFRVGAEEFAVDIMLVKEVVMMREITPVPETAAFVEGVMNLRGSLVPVVDLRKRLRARRAADGTDRRILIARLENKPIGLIVDGASEVVRVSRDMIEPAPDVIRELDADYVAGIINLGERFVTLMDVERALTGDISSELERVMASLGRGSAEPAQAV